MAKNSSLDVSLRYDEKRNKMVVVPKNVKAYDKRYKKSQNKRILDRLVKFMAEEFSMDSYENLSNEELTRVILNNLNITMFFSEAVILFNDSNMGKLVSIAAICNYLIGQGYSADELRSNLNYNELSKKMGKYNPNKSNEYAESQTEYILDYLDYIQMDKLCMAYIIQYFQNTIITNPQQDTYEVVQRMYINKEFVNGLLNLHIINNSTEVEIYEGEKFTLKHVKRLMRNYSGKLYLTPENRQYFMQKLEEKDEFLWSNGSLIRDLNLSGQEKKKLAFSDFNQFKVMYEEQIIDKDFILRNIDGQAKNKWMILFLLEEGIFTESDIKMLYEKDTISFNEMEDLCVDFDKMTELASNEELVKAYRNYIKAMIAYEKDETPKNKETLNNAILLKNKRMAFYKKYKLEGLTLEQKTENAEKLISSYFSQEGKNDDILEVLREMYKDRIVNFEAINNSNPKLLQELLINVMLKRGELTLEDTTRLKKNFTIEEQKAIVEEAFKDKDISENQKFILVMDMFFENTEDDNSARYEFLERFRATMFVGNLDPKFDNSGVEPDPSPNPNPNPNPDDWNRNVYPDNIKWILFMSIDKDAIPTRYDNGYVEFYLPKFNARVVEKYHDVDSATHKIKGPAYGVATYIMDDETFRTENDVLVEINADGGADINERNLRKVVPRTDRVSHVTKSVDKNWMRSLVKKLGIDLTGDTRYTEEELGNLENVIKTYESCYERY